jgi:hypothetical protein
MAVWYIFSRFSWLHQEKSGNPEPKVKELTRIEVESFLRDFFRKSLSWRHLHFEHCLLFSAACLAGLPNGSFSNQKIPNWVNFGVPLIGK